MRLSFNRDDVEYCNIIREYMVPTKEQIKIPLLIYIHMKEKLAGVYARVGTAATEYLGRFL